MKWTFYWLQGTGLGHFRDIDQLTMFADYRVPAVLREMGILQYSPQLAAKVRSSALPQLTCCLVIATKCTELLHASRQSDCLPSGLHVGFRCPKLPLPWPC